MCLGVALGSLSHLFLFCTGVQDSQTSSGKRKTPFHLSSAPILYKSGLGRELVGGHSLISRLAVGQEVQSMYSPFFLLSVGA